MAALSLANSIPQKLEQLLGTGKNSTASPKGFVRALATGVTIATGTNIPTASANITVAGVAVGDVVLVAAPTAIVANQHVTGGTVTATDTVVLHAINVGAATGVSRTYNIIVAKFV